MLLYVLCGINLCKGLWHTLLVEQRLLLAQSPGSVANLCVDKRLYRPLFPTSDLDYTSIESLQQWLLRDRLLVEGAKWIRKFGLLGEEFVDGRDNRWHPFLQCVNNGIGSSIKRVPRNDTMSSSLACAVDLLDNGDNGSADVVEVENGWRGIETTSVEIVGIHHGNFGKRFKVPLLDRFGNIVHSFWDQCESVLE
jgi:hypothetical protein